MNAGKFIQNSNIKIYTFLIFWQQMMQFYTLIR